MIKRVCIDGTFRFFIHIFSQPMHSVECEMLIRTGAEERRYMYERPKMLQHATNHKSSGTLDKLVNPQPCTYFY